MKKLIFLALFISFLPAAHATKDLGVKVDADFGDLRGIDNSGTGTGAGTADDAFGDDPFNAGPLGGKPAGSRGSFVTNRGEYYEEFQDTDLDLNKRYSDDWQMTANYRTGGSEGISGTAAGNSGDASPEAAPGGVPFLSKIPLLGGLFRGSNKAGADRGLIVQVTPQVVRNENE